MARELVLATRRSKLALVQSNAVAAQLRLARPDIAVELRIIKTTGDKILDVALSKIGGKGLFTKEIEAALLSGEADLAVHSLKDLPTDLPQGLALAAMTERVDPRDVLISRDGGGIDDIPEGAVVGTSSLRRSAQLAHYRPDLQFKPIRGNVETRLRKLVDEDLGAIVLAGAGLLRLGLEDRISQWLPPEICLPAAGQGIVAIEVRADDRATSASVAALASEESIACAAAERAALTGLGGGCQTPIGLLARISGDECLLDGVVVGVTGQPYYSARASGPMADASSVGQSLAESLLAQGAGELIA